MIKISIVVPLYNKEKSIRKTIESILAQTYSNFELIIVNDGSKDNSLSIAKSITDARIKIIDKQNGGVSSARNRGILVASGDWIAFFDGDDIMYPHALQEYVYLINEFPGVKMISTSVDQSNKKYPSKPNRYLITDYDLAETISTARTGFSFTNSDCVCVKKECFSIIGMFNEQYTHGEDLDMWSRLAEITPIAKSDIATAYYIIDAENNSLTTIKTGKVAPIGLLNIPRRKFKTKSSRLRHGCKVFHNMFPKGFFKHPLRAIRLFLYYGDWVIKYAFIFIKYRAIYKND